MGRGERKREREKNLPQSKHAPNLFTPNSQNHTWRFGFSNEQCIPLWNLFKGIKSSSITPMHKIYALRCVYPHDPQISSSHCLLLIM